MVPHGTLKVVFVGPIFKIDSRLEIVPIPSGFPKGERQERLNFETVLDLGWGVPLDHESSIGIALENVFNVNHRRHGSGVKMRSRSRLFWFDPGVGVEAESCAYFAI